MPKVNNIPQEKPWYRRSSSWAWIVTGAFVLAVIITQIMADAAKNGQRPIGPNLALTKRSSLRRRQRRWVSVGASTALVTGNPTRMQPRMYVSSSRRAAMQILPVMPFKMATTTTSWTRMVVRKGSNLKTYRYSAYLKTNQSLTSFK